MKILIHDAAGEDHTYSGSDESIEDHLRGLFHSALKGVRKGDLRACLQVCARLHGIQIRILEGQMPAPMPKKKQFKDQYEGQKREYDMGVKSKWEDHDADLGNDPDETDDFD